MSLTRWLEKPEVRTRFKELLTSPPIVVAKTLVCPPRTKNYGLVGTAFDYLFRMSIEHRFDCVHSTSWIIEDVNGCLPLSKMKKSDTYEKFQEASFQNMQEVERIKTDFRQEHERFVTTGGLTDGLMYVVLCVSKLEMYERSGRWDDDFQEIDSEDIVDLRSLLEAVSWEQFRPRHIAVLNPTFAQASKSMGGADADVIVDNTIWELKVTKKQQIDANHLHQLIGYVVLAQMGGVDGIAEPPQIESVGFYLARTSQVFKWPVTDIITDSKLRELIDWTEQHIAQERRRIQKVLEDYRQRWMGHAQPSATRQKTKKISKHK